MNVSKVIDGSARWHVQQGDCLEVLRSMPDDSVDAIVTDPPAGIGFMGKEWDADKGGRDAWIAWLAERMREAMRVLKPGGHALVWALPRTSHWTGTALELAGFEIRDRVSHLFGSGFPKSLDIGKSIADRKGWGTSLKPACEDWWLVRKPIEAKTVAKQVLATGTGALNVDGCRVSTADDLNGGRYSNNKKGDDGAAYGSGINARSKEDYMQPEGRWPANLVLSHNVDCADACTEGCAVKALDAQSGNRPATLTGRADPNARHANPGDNHGASSFGGGNSAVYADSGGASRYFNVFYYTAKCGREDRENGCEHLPAKSAGELTGRNDNSDGLRSPRAGAGRGGGRRNTHPTVKSTELMRWLCRLITPPGGIVLDMFAGSGSTGVACSAEGFRFIGIELSAEYVEIARARIVGDAPLLNVGGIK